MSHKWKKLRHLFWIKEKDSDQFEALLKSIRCRNNLINVKHDDGTEAQYVHLTLNGALKNEGDSIVQGEVIALSGNTGKTTGPHLHFQVIQALTECEDTDPRENYTWYSCNSIPLTFKNTSEHCFGLLDSNFMSDGYTADSY